MFLLHFHLWKFCLLSVSELVTEHLVGVFSVTFTILPHIVVGFFVIVNCHILTSNVTDEERKNTI